MPERIDFAVLATNEELWELQHRYGRFGVVLIGGRLFLFHDENEAAGISKEITDQDVDRLLSVLLQYRDWRAGGPRPPELPEPVLAEMTDAELLNAGCQALLNHARRLSDPSFRLLSNALTSPETAVKATMLAQVARTAHVDLDALPARARAVLVKALARAGEIQHCGDSPRLR